LIVREARTASEPEALVAFFRASGMAMLIGRLSYSAVTGRRNRIARWRPVLRKRDAVIAFSATLAAGESARAQNAPDSSKTADFLFVQTAKGMTFDKPGGKLTLAGVSPVTLFFADRPERIAGT
jgi:hypothetical protein